MQTQIPSNKKEQRNDEEKTESSLTLSMIFFIHEEKNISKIEK